jgi:hypothetical protein
MTLIIQPNNNEHANDYNNERNHKEYQGNNSRDIECNMQNAECRM